MRLSELQIACLQRLADAAGGSGPMTTSDGWIRASMDGRHGTVVSGTASNLQYHGLAERQQQSKANGGSVWYRITDAGRTELEAQRARLAERAARTAGRVGTRRTVRG